MSDENKKNQGGPVVLPARRPDLSVLLGKSHDPFMKGQDIGWNACLDEITKLGPLYPAPADPEPRGAFAKCMEAMADRDAAHKREDILRAQLAERDALLRELDDAWNSHDGKERFYKLMTKIEALSSSAEPINDLCAEGAHEFVPFRSECVKCGEPYNAEPSAPIEPPYPKCTVLKDANVRYSNSTSPVERDERADFEAAWSQRLAELKIKHRGNEFYRVQPNDLYRWHNVQDAWEMWQARAALERKS